MTIRSLLAEAFRRKEQDDSSFVVQPTPDLARNELKKDIDNQDVSAVSNNLTSAILQDFFQDPKLENLDQSIDLLQDEVDPLANLFGNEFATEISDTSADYIPFEEHSTITQDTLEIPDTVPVLPINKSVIMDSVLPSSIAEHALLKLDEAVLISDKRHQLRFGNSMAEFLTGCFNGELTRNTLNEISQGPGKHNVNLWQHLDQVNEDQRFDAEVKTLDGASMVMTVSVTKLPEFNISELDEFSNGYVISLRDVTSSRNEAAETVRETLETIHSSHKISQEEKLIAVRSSLMMVLGFSELLHHGEYGAMNPQQFETFRNIEHHAKQMLDILTTIISPTEPIL